MAPVAPIALGLALGSQCLNGPCYPGNEYCGKPFEDAPTYHLQDQHGCDENDPNGPVYDPVHGVIHHFYQIHLAAAPGHGPDYGHFVSKDFVHWAPLPVAIWNGLDASVSPARVTPYDNEAIFTGSAVLVDGAGPGGRGKGVVNIYPGLCNKNDWEGCTTGTLLAQAVPADYAGDALLTNWTKPAYNPIVEGTQRDPSTPWKTPAGEWRMRTYDSKVYGCASDADLLAGKWYEIGTSKDFRTCECPSFYPLPPATPGFEDALAAAAAAGVLPTHVHKTSCGGDFWQVGTYTPGAPKALGEFKATPGWEELFAQKRVDFGNFYASKDNEYPSRGGGATRRINWGWAQIQPGSAQTLPREVTFNAAARTLQQYPIEELKELRGPALAASSAVTLTPDTPHFARAPAGAAKTTEALVTFTLPDTPATLSVNIGAPGAATGAKVSRIMSATDLPGSDYNITHYPVDTDPQTCQAACDADARCQAWTYVVRGSPAGSGDCCLKTAVPCPTTGSPAAKTCTSGAKTAATLPGCGGALATCAATWTPPADPTAAVDVPVACGQFKDTLTILPTERTLEVRVFTDVTFFEAFFQRGRVAFTAQAKVADDADVWAASTVATTADFKVYPMRGIWVDADTVRAQKRMYGDL